MTEAERNWWVISMASQAMVMALLGRDRHAAELIRRIEAEAGMEAVVDAMMFWIDTWLGIIGKPANADTVVLAFMDLRLGRERRVDEVPAEIAWAGRLMAARAADDNDQIVALINSVPPDPHLGGQLVQAVLHSCAGNLQHMGHDEERGAT